MNAIWSAIAAFAALLLSVGGMLYFGMPHDSNFDNPVYVTCIKGLHSPHDCELRILDRQTARNKARHAMASITGRQ